MASRTKRLIREVQDCKKDSSKSGIVLEQLDDSLENFVGSFPGPEGTAYEGGTFKVAITVPEKYPFAPLQCKFITRVYHPNISSATGLPCLDILKTAWSPVYTLRTVLVSLQVLLSTPEPSDPQDAEVAKHYLADFDSFQQTARAWTEVYAMAGSSSSAADQEHEQAQSTSGTGTGTHGSHSQTTGTSRHTNGSGGGVDDEPPDLHREARLAGIDWNDVATFSDMGFDPSQVLEVLKLLNYRGLDNKNRIGHDGVIERLCQ